MPKDRNPQTTYEGRVAELRGHIAAAQSELAEAAYELANSPENPGAMRKVEALRAEIREHEQSIELITLASEEAKRRAVLMDRSTALKLHRQRLTELATINREIEVTAFDLLSRLEDVAPVLVKLDNLMRERGATAWAMCQAALGTHEAGRKCSGQLQAAAVDSPIAAVILQAIQASGIGRTGPDLRPFLSFSPPSRQPLERERLKAGLDRANARLDTFIKQDVAPALEVGEDAALAGQGGT